MIHSTFHRAPSREPSRVLLVMLPGLGSEAGEFAARGFVSAAQDCRLPIDVLAAGPDLDLYLENRIALSLHEAVVSPALARGYARLWFLGISVGGMGALLYAAAQLAPVEGLVLLAPFLGTPGTVAEIAAAGDIALWSPENSRATTAERQMLLWLQNCLARPVLQPAVYLGYGRRDRFARGHGLLAQRLSPRQVAVAEGGHDWETWSALWQQVLERRPFTAESAASPQANR